MPALTASTLSQPLAARTTVVPVASASGLQIGWWLFVGGETSQIVSFEPTGNPRVRRAVKGHMPAIHPVGATVYAGPPEYFHTSDPVGRPGLYQQPHWVNVHSGQVWVAVGDEEGPNAASRTWVAQTITQVVGALGVRQTVVAPTSATS